MRSARFLGSLAVAAAMVLGLPGAAEAAKAKYKEGTVENGQIMHLSLLWEPKPGATKTSNRLPCAGKRTTDNS